MGLDAQMWFFHSTSCAIYIIQNWFTRVQISGPHRSNKATQRMSLFGLCFLSLQPSLSYESIHRQRIYVIVDSEHYQNTTLIADAWPVGMADSVWFRFPKISIGTRSVPTQYFPNANNVAARKTFPIRYHGTPSDPAPRFTVEVKRGRILRDRANRLSHLISSFFRW